MPENLPAYLIGRSYRFAKGVQFWIDGEPNTHVKIEFPHLGQIISSNLDDKSEILAKRNSPCAVS